MGALAWILTFLPLLIIHASAFNVDLPSRILHRSDQPESMFGFSVAMHKSNDNNWLLVGAPRYNTAQRRFGVENAGAVLKCSSKVPNNCDYVPFDKNGNNLHPLGQQIDEKSNQWFGATLKSSGNDGVVVACAPRYLWYSENLRRREPVGTCYVARNGLTDFQEYSPCRTRSWGYHRQGSCQAGFDAAVTKEGDRLYIGAPGAYYWQGQIHSQHLHERPRYYKTGEGPAIDDDQYLGYSVGTGDFTGDGIADVALGVPKGLNYTGKVAIYTHDLQNLQNITGYQLGSYFGYCLTVTDFNGDGRDDIIVGAPLYTDYADKEMKYEVGRVHILLQNSLHRFTDVITFSGDATKARFGLSVAAVGDIDMDGFNDIAVGAPYGGKFGNGAVYIYHGFQHRSGDVFNKKPVQVIHGSDVSSRLTTFGWSLAGGLDMDNNLYPDILVGAYLSNTAVLLKSKPVIAMVNRTLTFMSRTINIENPTCNTVTGKSVPCLDLQLCMTYSGVGVGQEAEFIVQYSLDGKVNDPRLLFIENNNRVLRENVNIRKDSPYCKTRKVYVRDTLRDKLSPLTAEVNYALASSNTPRQRVRRGSSLPPVLRQEHQANLQDSVSIRKNCGLDDVCIPDLILTVTAPSSYTLGQTEQLSINVRVTNDAEDAFEAAVFILIPSGLLYNKFIERENTSVTCSPRRKDGQSVIVCNIGNPLRMHKGVVFDVYFQEARTLEKPSFEFFVTANSTNKESTHTMLDNTASLSVDANVDTELILYGNSDPEMLEYNVSEYRSEGWTHEEEFGPQVVHRYGLLNNGSSDILQVDIVILWPQETSSGNDLLYLLEKPFTNGPVVCEDIQQLNPRNIKLYERKDFYNSIRRSKGQASASSGFPSYNDQSSSHSAVDGSYRSSGNNYRTAVLRENYDDYVTDGDNELGESKSTSSATSNFYSYGDKNYTYSSSSSSSSSYKSDSAAQNSIGRRYERSADEPELDWNIEINRCGDVKCLAIKCTAGPLAEDDYIDIYIRSRLALHTLQQFIHRDAKISSKIVARVNSLPQKVNPDFLKVRALSVSTPVSPVVSLDTPPPVPWWIILLATLVGIFILVIIILTLWKCGYFRRNRPNHDRLDEASCPLQYNNHSNGRSPSTTSGNKVHQKSLNGRSCTSTSFPSDEAL